MHVYITNYLVKLEYIDALFAFAPYFEDICYLIKGEDPVEVPIVHKFHKSLQIQVTYLFFHISEVSL